MKIRAWDNYLEYKRDQAYYLYVHSTEQKTSSMEIYFFYVLFRPSLVVHLGLTIIHRHFRRNMGCHV